MDDRHAVEEVVREYFQERGSRADLATGKLEALCRLPELPTDVAKFTESYSFRELRAREIRDDVALVDLHGAWEGNLADPSLGRVKRSAHIAGPVLLHRIGGSWKVADYVIDGRRRSESIVIDPAGTQESDGLGLSILAVDRQSNITILHTAVTNARDAPVEWEWGALGSPRRRSWRFKEIALTSSRLPPGGPHILDIQGPPVPVGTKELRLILVERPRRPTFDLVVRLDATRAELPDVQRAPDSLPLRLRFERSPWAFLGLLPLVALVLLLGGLQAVGVALIGFGLALVGLAVWNRARGRPVLLAKALGIAAALVGGGVALLYAVGAAT